MIKTLQGFEEGSFKLKLRKICKKQSDGLNSNPLKNYG